MNDSDSKLLAHCADLADKYSMNLSFATTEDKADLVYNTAVDLCIENMFMHGLPKTLRRKIKKIYTNRMIDHEFNRRLREQILEKQKNCKWRGKDNG